MAKKVNWKSNVDKATIESIPIGKFVGFGAIGMNDASDALDNTACSPSGDFLHIIADPCPSLLKLRTIRDASQGFCL